MGEKDLPPKPKYYHGMGIKELVEYCSLHYENPRALLSTGMIAQMIAYAGNPQGYPLLKKWPMPTQNGSPLLNK